MPDRQPCHRSNDHFCPADGQYQFNTDVVFSDNGTLVGRYHKQNLYFEAAYDTPANCEYVTFTTPFAGRFGVFTCFDILFRDPAVTLVKDMGIRQLVYPTAWMNQLPLLAAVQFQRSFSYSTGATLLAANIRSAALGMTGSGIYTPWDAVYHHALEGETGKLLVHTVPVLDRSLLRGATEREKIRLVPFSGHSGVEKERLWSVKEFQNNSDRQYCRKEDSNRASSDKPAPFTSTMMHDTFTLELLYGRQGNITVCDGLFCCHLLFHRTKSYDELYALGAFNGLHVVHGTYHLEICALIRCAGLDETSCGEEIEQAQTLVDFHLSGTFSTHYVYAGVMGSGMTLEPPDQSGWNN